MSAELDVVLVRPKEDGNVGAVARAARNFGADRLTLVAPRATIGPEARRRAMGGMALLERARRTTSLADALDGADLVVGSTDLVTGRSSSYLRRPISPERLGEILRTVTGRAAIVFGPEDNGLSRTELRRCDLLVHVPARREFPTLNLSHAAGIVLYAIHRARAGNDDPRSTPAPEALDLDGRGKEVFLSQLDEILEATGYPSHKRPGLVLLFRRVLGRAVPSESEYRMMLGLFKATRRAMRSRR